MGNGYKTKADQKYEETGLKFEETDQQNQIFKVFEKSGNGSKIWGKGPTNMRKLIKKRGNLSTLNIGKRIQNIRKSLKNFDFLRDFLEFLKTTEIPQT